ncbi:uncharacterized protein [Nicotiana tomentosiformis]|uniref:uncharacterized protein n=1 Tax=Nicotiana tomentosiformis TaxID=4098 RepID=UPI00388C9667
MVINDQTSQVQQKIDRIDQLLAEMNKVQAMADVWKGKMDRLASEKETAREQLPLVEVQLRVAKEKADAWARQNEDLQAQLGLAIAERDALGNKLEITKSESETTRAGDLRRARGFNLSAEIEEAKRLKAEAKKLAEPEGEETSEGSDEPEDGEDPDDSGDEGGSSGDQA